MYACVFYSVCLLNFNRNYIFCSEKDPRFCGASMLTCFSLELLHNILLLFFHESFYLTRILNKNLKNF